MSVYLRLYHCALFNHLGVAFYHSLLTRITRLLGCLLLTVSLSPTLLLPFVQIAWASENATALYSSHTHQLHDNDKQLPATLNAWKEVDLVYEHMFPYDPARQPHPPVGCTVLHVGSHRSNTHNIDTKILMTPIVLMLLCRERVNLLRPARWVNNQEQKQYRQGYIVLNLPEMGIHDVDAHIVAVTSSLFNPAVLAMKHSLSRPVIGLFIRHTTDVNRYVFKDTLTGKLDRIKATPNHPFYVVNQQRYIPVSLLSPYDKMINVLGHPVTLVCPPGKSSHCGQPYHPGQVIRVYNLEVYGQHRYFVGQSGIMVHNAYRCTVCGQPFNDSTQLKFHEITHVGEKPYVCEQCGIRFRKNVDLGRHLRRTHLEEKPFKCQICSEKFVRNAALQKHLLTKLHKNNAALERLNTLTDELADIVEESKALPVISDSSGSEQMSERSPSTHGFDIPFSLSPEDFIPYFPYVVRPPIDEDIDESEWLDNIDNIVDPTNS